MSIFDKVKDNVNAIFSDWIKVYDPKSNWTIEDFPYNTGVDENLTNPHCWKCVTVNQYWFKNENGKKTEEFDYSQYTYGQIPFSKRGLYHPNCHDKKLKIEQPKPKEIKFEIPFGKIEWMIKDKGHLLKSMGYKESEFIEVVEIIKNLVAKEFVDGNYNFKAHDEKGFRIGFILKTFPGKNEDFRKNYKLKTGWSIFQNGKLKCNTLIGGLEK